MELKIEYMGINDIKPYKNNAKKHSERQIQAVANSIKSFGFKQPIVIDKNAEIIIGHGRFEAAKILGLKSVPCVRADDLTPSQVKALRIADNKTNESEWDFDVLSAELDGIFDFDMTDLGFNEAELLELQIDDTPEELPHKEDLVSVGMAEVPSYSDSGSNAVPNVDYKPISGSTGSALTQEDLQLYADKAEAMTSRRVIVMYRTDEEELFLKRLFKIDEKKPLTVLVDVKNIMKASGENAESEE